MDVEDGQPGTQNTDARRALERFVVENDDLLALESRIGRFNIFDALGIARVEIRHSNFLAFILDPAESHGQGPIFPKAVLMDLLKQAPPELRPLSPIDLDGADLRGVEVKREWKNIDLLITCKEPRFAVVIENKVGAGEHSNQLSRYERIMKDYHPDLRALYVFLTPDGDEPSEDSWHPYTYADIHRVLTRIRQMHQNAIGDDVRVFLDHYLELLGTRFMKDQELDELCQRIYKNHRQALDLIWERVGSPASSELAEAADVLEGDAHWRVVGPPGSAINFVPKAWLDWLPQLSSRGDPQSWIHAYFWWAGDRLRCGVDMGPMKDPAKRVEIATNLLDQCVACGFRRPRSKEVKNNVSRIAAVETILQWSEDDKPEPEKVREAVNKALGDLRPRLEKLALVLKPLCSPPGSAQ
jgi:hypothetical protein